jgi:anti-anti-sigma factor
MANEVSEQRGRLRAAECFELGQFSVRSDRDGVVHMISLSGELDLATAPAVERELERVEATDAGSIVLDLSDLTFMDSTGARLIIQAHQRSRADANRLALLRGPAAVQRVLELSGVSDLLPFAD